MKLAIISPDANGVIDGTLQSFILSRLPIVESVAACDAVIVPVAYHPGYVFNTALVGISKPVVLLDFLEAGWDAGDRENRLGKGMLHQFGHLSSIEWAKLDQWAAAYPPKLTFMRELKERDRTESLLPIEFPCAPAITAVQTKAEFDARPFEVFSCWGHSNPMRPRVHGDIFHAMGNRGISIISDWSQIDGMPAQPRTWVSLYSPYWCRRPMAQIMALQQRSKISISLFGAGRKSFRDAEACVGAVMARPMEDPPMAWSFPWTDSNSLRMGWGSEVEELLAFVGDSDFLWDIYRAGQENATRYRPDAYAADYILPTIASRL